ncbi:thermonuclease family protein [bacterium]|nr:thermonuclease family protein [bacterium]
MLAPPKRFPARPSATLSAGLGIKRLRHLLLLAIVVGTTATEARWYEYRCQLAEDCYFDGDSFHAQADTGYTYIFRLYGADCPETDTRVPERLKEQCQYFGVDQPTLRKWGQRAKAYVRRKLQRGFTVHTQKHEARGASDQNRYYAVVMVGEENLAELLVAEGLARAYGQGVAFPDDGRHREADFRRRRRRLETAARRDGKGIWGEQQGTQFHYSVRGCAETATGLVARVRGAQRTVAPTLQVGRGSLRYFRSGGHRCCRQVDVRPRIDAGKIALTEFWTGQGCRCQCFSEISATVSNLASGPYTVTVDRGGVAPGSDQVLEPEVVLSRKVVVP